MREVLDRLREAETALNKQLNDVYYSENGSHRDRAIVLLWKAKRSLWYAQMCSVDAFAGAQTPIPD